MCVCVFGVGGFLEICCNMVKFRVNCIMDMAGMEE